MNRDDTTVDGQEPWWASGRTPDEGLDPDEDGFEAHDAARRARSPHDGQAETPPHWLTDLVEMLARLAATGTARMGGDRTARGPAPHPPEQVCDACPICIGLRAVCEVRPEAIAHLAEAARQVSLALQSFADAQSRAVVGDGYERIDLDTE